MKHFGQKIDKNCLKETQQGSIGYTLTNHLPRMDVPN